MLGEATDNNVVTISGKVATELKYSHEIYGEGFYQFILDVPRLSDSNDSISVTISERLIDPRGLPPGTLVNIEGQFRSYNSFGESGNKLLLTVFVREIEYIEDESQIRNSNKIYLNGFICKKPVYRSTPFGREITDLLVAVNRAYNKSDYIPCISWGRNARFCSNLNVGDNIKIWGRIQSRAYQKKMPDGGTMARIAYEVSLSKLEITDARRTDRNAAAEGDDVSADEPGSGSAMYGAEASGTDVFGAHGAKVVSDEAVRGWVDAAKPGIAVSAAAQSGLGMSGSGSAFTDSMSEIQPAALSGSGARADSPNDVTQ